MFGATKAYPLLVESIGFYGTFWMYGVVMMFEVLYGAFSIPENKGESLVHTEDKMVNSNVKVEDEQLESHKSLLDSTV